VTTSHYIVKAKEQSKQHATPEERKRLKLLESELRLAIDECDIESARIRLEEIKSLYYRMQFRDVEYLAGFLDFLEGKRSTMTDQTTADHYFKQGRRAQTESDASKMFEMIRHLFSLMPEEQRQKSEESLGYGSTVMLKY
jgi:hypothetical protein